MVVWGPILENPMEKDMEHEMDIGLYIGVSRV